MRFTLQVEQKHSSLILGLNLRFARLKAGLSLRDMGELVNISHTLIANIEHGKTIANQDTLRDLFAVLHIQYRDDEELIQAFSKRYDRVFNNLYMFHYDRTVEDIKYLEENEETFFNSIVIIDYSLLRFLHAALTDSMTPYLRENLDLMKRVSTLFSPRQQQLRHLVMGIELHNQGWFQESEVELAQASKIGDNRLDPLIELYRVRNMVRMFRFMDAQKTAERTIKRFEADLNYQRAMLVRLQLAYSHISLKKYETSREYIDLVDQYAEEYKHPYLLKKCLDLRLSHALMQLNIPNIEALIAAVKTETVTTIIGRMYLAGMQGDKTSLARHYHTFQALQQVRQKEREQLFVHGLMILLDGIQYDDKEFVTTFEHIIERSRRGIDMEVLLFGYEQLIQYYRRKRMYKRALELSEEARNFRSYGRIHG